jgi:hypothetical protein
VCGLYAVMADQPIVIHLNNFFAYLLVIYYYAYLCCRRLFELFSHRRLDKFKWKKNVIKQGVVVWHPEVSKYKHWKFNLFTTFREKSNTHQEKSNDTIAEIFRYMYICKLITIDFFFIIRLFISIFGRKLF